MFLQRVFKQKNRMQIFFEDHFNPIFGEQ